MRILHISDTHGKHNLLKDLPKADIIVHSGDVSWAGTGKEVVDFVDWFGALNYQYKIFIAGNHDFCLEGKKLESIQRFLPENCFYLCNSGVEIEGLKFWGVPFFFSDDFTRNYPQTIEQIPTDTDVLISHHPPYEVLDFADKTTYGCLDLLQKALEIRPKYHLFGHIHNAYGIEKSQHTTFVNSAIMNGMYEFVNNPKLLEIWK